MECAPLSIRATKEAALKGLGMPLEHALAQQFPALRKLLGSEDLKEGPRAFAEKRKPLWRGR
jgi:dehydration protein DpgD